LSPVYVRERQYPTTCGTSDRPGDRHPPRAGTTLARVRTGLPLAASVRSQSSPRRSGMKDLRDLGMRKAQCWSDRPGAECRLHGNEIRAATPPRNEFEDPQSTHMNQGARDIAFTFHAQNLGFEIDQPAGLVAQLPQPPGAVQQIEVLEFP